ncbi:MAG: YggT family protein, partial [Gammaproteobacteria bacterium]
YNPLTVLIHQLTDPLLRPVRRRLPTMGGLDWSPMIVLLGIYLFLTLIVAPLLDYGNALNGYPIRLL